MLSFILLKSAEAAKGVEISYQRHAHIYMHRHIYACLHSWSSEATK